MSAFRERYKTTNRERLQRRYLKMNNNITKRPVEIWGVLVYDKKKYVNKVKGKNMVKLVERRKYRVDVYFGILCVLLVPALYFLISGSEWKIWGIIPENYHRILIDGNETLYNMGLAYVCSFIFYVFVNYLPEKRKVKNETYRFLFDVQQYMFAVYHAVFFDIDKPEIFIKKLYNKPERPDVIYREKEWRGIMDTFQANYMEIEAYYCAYRSYSGKSLSESDKEYVNECIQKLHKFGLEYLKCANEMVDIFYKRVTVNEE